MKLEKEDISLAPDLKLRPVQLTDVAGVTKLIFDVCTADGDPTMATTEEEMLRFWQGGAEFNPATDAWVVESPDGQIVGYEEFFNRYAHSSLNGDGYVHPDYLGRGIGTAMLKVLVRRAAEEEPLAEPDLRVFLRNNMGTKDKSGHEIHEAAGFKAIRYSWHMQIELDGPPPAPEWPEGIELRPFDREQHDRLVFEADEEAFRDHWGHTPWTHERWERFMYGREDFDPSLWFIAWEGDQIAGIALDRMRMGIGWVGILGVRRPWRKKGLGLALLRHSFGEFYRRGQPVIGLGVDAENPTGATRLYKKAGMQVSHEYVIYEKEFRPGREPSGDE